MSTKSEGAHKLKMNTVWDLKSGIPKYGRPEIRNFFLLALRGENAKFFTRTQKKYFVGSYFCWWKNDEQREIFKAFMESDVPELMAHRKTLHNLKSIDVDRVLMEWIRPRQRTFH